MSSEHQRPASAEQPVYYCNKCHYLGIDKMHRVAGTYDKRCQYEAVQLAAVPYTAISPEQRANSQDSQ